MRRNQKTLGRDVKDISARMAAIDEGLARALANLGDCLPGYPSQSMGGGGVPRLGDDGTPAGLERFVLRADPASQALDELERCVASMMLAATEAHRIVMVWALPADRTAVELSAGEGECIECGAYAKGTAQDRLRSGMCSSCYQAWRRWRQANKGDRHAWRVMRRAEAREAVDA